MRPPAVADHGGGNSIVVFIEHITIDVYVHAWQELLSSDRLYVVAQVSGGVRQQTITHLLAFN